MQMVRLVRDGEIVKASKRSGKAITLVTLLEEVPVDAARFLFNSYEPNTRIDFDLDLAVQEDSQNPVYYVQYAHARICSILKNLKADGIEPRECTVEELSLLTAPEELELIRYLSAFTGEVAAAAKLKDPAKITRYVMNLSTLFHKILQHLPGQGQRRGPPGRPAVPVHRHPHRAGKRPGPVQSHRPGEHVTRGRAPGGSPREELCFP